jgi:ubiquinone/menaquinone biosynthesis C-methylase UbiE
VRIDRLIPCVLAFATPFALGGCNGLSKLDWTTLGRASWQRPEDVVRALDLRPGDRVADLGAGEGYFLPYLSEAVGSQGRVFAVEVESELAEQLEAQFADGDNVEVVLGRTDDPQLPDGSIDLALIVNTYHHIEDRPAYFTRLKRDLSASGRVAIIDPDADLGGVLSLFLDDGHDSSACHDFLAVQVFEVFAPEDDAG